MPLHLPTRGWGWEKNHHGGVWDGLRERVLACPHHHPWSGHRATDTNFISEELLSKATKDSTLVESGQKQGWSGFRILPSSGIQVCIHVSKKGTCAPVLDSDRIT